MKLEKQFQNQFRTVLLARLKLRPWEPLKEFKKERYVVRPRF